MSSKRTREFAGRPGHPTTFTTVAGEEPDDVVGETMVAESTATPFDLRPGDGDYINDGISAVGPIERVYVSRGPGNSSDVYDITAEHAADVYALIPSITRDKEAWLDARQGLLVEFYRGRYNAEITVNETWDTTVASFTIEHHGPVTEDQAFQIAWDETRATLAFNESDPGTNGSENADRLFREFCAEHVISGVRGYAADDLSAEQIDDEVGKRMKAGREISDITAVAVARELGNENHPELRRLGTLGYANRDRLRLDLIDAYATRDRRVKDRIDMLGTWSINGGDNL